MSAGPLAADELRRLDASWRAANYLSVEQIYLLDDPLLREPLKLEYGPGAAVRTLVTEAREDLEMAARSARASSRQPQPFGACPTGSKQSASPWLELPSR